MPGWNPASGSNTLEQTYRLGRTDTRKQIADHVEQLLKSEPNIEPAEIVKRIRAGEMDPQ